LERSSLGDLGLGGRINVKNISLKGMVQGVYWFYPFQDTDKIMVPMNKAN
jgi:hypothetical protein